MNLSDVENARVKVRTLTPRQHEVMVMLGQGMDTREIGKKLCRSPETIENHLQSITAHLGVKGRTRVALLAVKLGMA